MLDITIDFTNKDYFIIYISEVFELFQTLQAIESQNIKLQKLAKDKDRVLAQICHDMRTPLSGVNFIISALRDGQQFKPEELKQYLNICLSNNELLMSLVNDIMDFNQYEEGKLKLDIQEFCLLDFLNELLITMGIQASLKNLELKLKYDEKIVQKLNSNIISDQRRLKQILINLIGNALKFTLQGYIEIQVRLYRDLIQFTVCDTGVGIKQNIIKHIGQPYKTYDTEQGLNKQGIGLGLAICKKIIGLLGPEEKIYIESQEGKGSKFMFQIFQNQQQIKKQDLLFNWDLKLQESEEFLSQESLTENNNAEKPNSQSLLLLRALKSKKISQEITKQQKNNNFINIYCQRSAVEDDDSKLISEEPLIQFPSDYVQSFNKLTNHDYYDALKIKLFSSKQEFSESQYDEINEEVNNEENNNSFQLFTKNYLAIFSLPVIEEMKESQEEIYHNNVFRQLSLEKIQQNHCDETYANSGKRSLQKTIDKLDYDKSCSPTPTAKYNYSKYQYLGNFSNEFESLCQSIGVQSSSSMLYKLISKVSSNYSKQSTQTMNILCVDDQFFNLLILKNYIEKLSQSFANITLTCFQSQSGPQAIELFKQYNEIDNQLKFQLILMDCCMPIMDGFETTQEIRQLIKEKNYVDCKIIACTANWIQNDQEENKYKEAGFDLIINKPISENEFKKLIESTINLFYPKRKLQKQRLSQRIQKLPGFANLKEISLSKLNSN